MAKKEDLAGWVIEAVVAHKGKATIVQICKHVWDNHEKVYANQAIFSTRGDMTFGGLGNGFATMNTCNPKKLVRVVFGQPHRRGTARPSRGYPNHEDVSK